jgi:hypothetical protein
VLDAVLFLRIQIIEKKFIVLLFADMSIGKSKGLTEARFIHLTKKQSAAPSAGNLILLAFGISINQFIVLQNVAITA